MNLKSSIDLKGIIIAADWGPDGKITAVDIAGYDEKRYRIANDSQGCELHRLVKQSVVVHGRVSSENQRHTIHVEHFRVDTEDPVAAGFK